MHVSPAVDEQTPLAQQRRRERILAVTRTLALEGGYDHVQMRTVAERAEVALGTLYRYFPSKIHLLAGGLIGDLEAIEAGLSARGVPGESPADRVRRVFYQSVSRAISDFPGLLDAYGRAMAYAAASAHQESTHVEMIRHRLLTMALVDQATERPHEPHPSEEQARVVAILGDVWMASVLGWMTGRLTATEVDARLDQVVGMLIAG